MTLQAQEARAMSMQDLAAFGLQMIAYVKPVIVNNEKVYAIHAADGTQVAVATSLPLAYAAIRQNDMEPVSAH